MKKILLISYLFPPENTIGSIRPAKIAKYLSLLENDVDVVTTSFKEHYDKSQMEKCSRDIKVIELAHSKVISNYKNRKIASSTQKKENASLNQNNKKKNVFELLKKYIYHSLNVAISIDYYLSFKKHVNKNKEKYNNYDVVITTFGPTASVLCGLFFKRKYPHIKWVCDFRDPMVVDILPPIINRFNLFIQERACKRADIIVAVSNGYLKRIIKEKYKEKSLVIPNGYDKSDLNLNIEQKNNLNDMFEFTYTGSLYNGKRDLSAIFQVLNDLINENRIKKQYLVFNYAGNDYLSLFNQAKKYGLEDIIKNYGFVSREESFKLQKRARYLVLSTWNSKNEIGVFPGKFLEYMLFEKPIISIVNGEVPNSEVTKVMNESNLGISYESARHDKDYISFKKFLDLEYTNFIQGLQPKFEPNKSVIDRYNYMTIAKKFEEII